GGACVDCGTAGYGCAANVSCSCGGASACAAGFECLSGSCKCTPSSCPSGCCDGNSCQTIGFPARCGLAPGGACDTCDLRSDSCDGSGHCFCNAAGAACAAGQECTAGGC